MFGRFQQDRKAREGQPTDEMMIDLYGTLVFEEGKTLVMELVAARIVLDSDRFEHIKEVAGQDFAQKVGDLKDRISKTVTKEHGGYFDGWVKRVVNENFGPGTDFAMEHGDQTTNFYCVVLKGQALKHSAIQVVMEFLGVKSFQETRAFVGSKLAEATKKAEAVDIEIEEKKKQGAPKQGDYPVFTEFLKAKIAYETLTRKDGARISEVKRAIGLLKSWVANKEGEKQDRSKQQMLIDRASELGTEIAKLKDEEKVFAGNGDYVNATATQKAWKELETEVRKVTKEFGDLDTAANQASREQGVQAIAAGEQPMPGVVGEPLGKPTVTGDPAQAMQQAGNVAGKIAAHKAEIEKLKKEIKQHEDAIERKEREAIEKSKAARAEGVSDEDAETLLREARTLRASAKATSQTAEKLHKDVEDLAGQIAELEKQVVPAAAQKPKKVKGAKAPDSGAVTPPPATSEPAGAAAGATEPSNGGQDVKAKAIAMLQEQLAAAVLASNDAEADSATRKLKAMGVAM